ncbi:hypothetical protein ACVWWN_000581 [Mycobacterium sp. URHB0021]
MLSRPPLRLQDRAAVDGFSAAALQFGAYDLSGQTPAGRHIVDEYFILAYPGHVHDRTSPDISPIYGDLHGLPPCFWSWEATTCYWKTTWRWRVDSPPPAMKSNLGSIPSHPTGSRATRRQRAGRRSEASLHGWSSTPPTHRASRRELVTARCRSRWGDAVITPVGEVPNFDRSKMLTETLILLLSNGIT